MKTNIDDNKEKRLIAVDECSILKSLLFDWQKDLLIWAIKKGKGKTLSPNDIISYDIVK